MALAIDSQEASNAGHRAAGSSSLTWSFTNTAGTLLVVGIVLTASALTPTDGGVTYAGTAMTKAISITWAGGDSYTAFYYLVTPATGSNSVVVSSSPAPTAILGGAISFTGQNSTPIGTTSTNTDGGGTGTHATAGSITAPSGDYVLGVGGWGSGTAASADSGQTATFKLVGSGATAGDDICCVEEQSSGAAINPGFTWTGADHWGMVGVQIKAAGGGGGGGIPDLIMAPMVAS